MTKFYEISKQYKAYVSPTCVVYILFLKWKYLKITVNRIESLTRPIGTLQTIATTIASELPQPLKVRHFHINHSQWRHLKA